MIRNRKTNNKVRHMLTHLLFSAISISALASNIENTDTQIEIENTINSSTQSDIEVTADISSSWIVTLPKAIQLNADQTGSGVYTSSIHVTVQGDIGQGEIITVKSDETAQLTDTSGVSNTQDITLANITLNTTKFGREVLENNQIAETTHQVQANLTPGDWSGTIPFDINIDKIYNIPVTSKDQAGNNLNATSTLIKGEEKEALLDCLEQTGMITSKDDVDLLIDVKSDDFEGLADTTFDVSNIAQQGDKVTILHFDETRGEWEYISTEIVDENGEVSANFSSYSPVAFVKVNSDGSYSEHQHVYGSTVTREATCTLEGILTYKCYCGNSYTQTIVKKPHSYVNQKCSTCGEINYINFTITPSNYTQAGIKREGTVNIPATFTYDNKYYKTVGIGSSAFEDCSNLTSITIPNTVTSIGSYAFENCTRLTTVNMPNTITSIGNNAFYNCKVMPSIKLSTSLTAISSNTFQYCYKLGSITIPNSVKSIGSGAFTYCEELSSISIPDSVTSISQYAFEGCKSLGNVRIGNNVTSIGKGAFTRCTGIYTLTLPVTLNVSDSSIFSGATSIDTVNFTPGTTGVMVGYSSSSMKGTPWGISIEDLDTVTFAEGVKSIGSSAFYGCKQLDKVSLPSTLTRIGSSAFYGCNTLASILIPNSVTHIDSSAFESCKGLTSITLSNQLTSLGTKVFGYCEGLTSITLPNTLTSIPNDTFLYCEGLTSITIPSSVTSIGNSAFYGCSELRSATIGDNVTSIGNSAFSRCTSLSSLTMPITLNIGSSTVFNQSTNIDRVTLTRGVGTIPSHNYTYMPWYISAEDFDTLIIKDGMESIESSLFTDCKALTSITLPSTLKSIGNSSFKGCGMTSITLPSSLESIGYNSFEGCTKLTSITIPDNITNIGSSAFKGCTSLATVKLGKGITKLADSVFYNCDKLDNLTLPSELKEIGNSAFYGCGTLYSVTIPESVTTIGKSAFKYCQGLSRLVISSSVSNIGESAFSNCTNLSSLTMSAHLDLSNSSLFSGCTSLDSLRLTKGTGKMYAYNSTTYKYTPWYLSAADFDSLTIDEGVTNISTYAFADCNVLSSISLPSTITTIGSNAFLNCKKIKNELTLPNDLVSIHSDAFKNCESIPTIIMKNNVTTIGDNAFNGCKMLSTLTISNNIETLNYGVFANCESLQTVTLPTNLKKIGKYAFSGSGLTSIDIPDTVTEIGDDAFWYCESLRNVDIGLGIITLGSDAFGYCTALGYLSIPDDFKITNDAFYKVEELYSISFKYRSGKVVAYSESELSNTPWYNSREELHKAYFDEGITHIGDNILRNCGWLSSPKFPSTLVSIGDNAFIHDYNITEFVMGNNLKSIGKYAFYGTGVREITTGPNLEYIGGLAFGHCASLTNVNITGKLTELDGFGGCANLTSVSIGPNITTISGGAFSGCTKLSIYVPTTVTTIGSSAFYNVRHVLYNGTATGAPWGAQDLN